MFRITKAIFLFISTVIMGMFGGQKNKGTRRFGIPGLAILISLTEKFKLRHLSFLLLIPILTMGYGENSFLGSIFPDFLVRIVYGGLLSLPFIFFGLKRWLLALISLIIAFSIRANSLGYIPLFGDILIEDIARYSVLAILIIINIFIPKRNDK